MTTPDIWLDRWKSAARSASSTPPGYGDGVGYMPPLGLNGWYDEDSAAAMAAAFAAATTAAEGAVAGIRTGSVPVASMR